MDRPTIILQPIDPAAPLARTRLHPREQAQLSPHARPMRQADFVGGRLAAKRAAERSFTGTFAVLARTRPPRKDAPELFKVSAAGLERFNGAEVSIAHQAPLAAAAVWKKAVGIDLVEVKSVTADVDALLFTPDEVAEWAALVASVSTLGEATGRDVLFGIKECVLKVLGEGLRLDPLTFKVSAPLGLHCAPGAEGVQLPRVHIAHNRDRDPTLKQGSERPMPLLTGRIRRHQALIEVLLWEETLTTKT